MTHSTARIAGPAITHDEDYWLKLQSATEQPATKKYPLPVNLDKYIEAPGLNRGSEAVDIYHPHGTQDVSELKGSEKTVLMKHCQFFDSNNDNWITPIETYNGFRRLGWSIPISGLSVILIHSLMWVPSQPSWRLSPTFSIYIPQIHRGRHGSDSKVYDQEGRFSPMNFESILSKFDKDKKGGLYLNEMIDMIRENRQIFDFAGQFAAAFEWGFLWWLAADNGVLRRETIRGMFDGSLFYRIEAERHGKQPVDQNRLFKPTKKKEP